MQLLSDGRASGVTAPPPTWAAASRMERTTTRVKELVVDIIGDPSRYGVGRVLRREPKKSPFACQPIAENASQRERCSQFCGTLRRSSECRVEAIEVPTIPAEREAIQSLVCYILLSGGMLADYHCC